MTLKLFKEFFPGARVNFGNFKNLTSMGALNIPRKEMPQIKGDLTKEFLAWIKQQKIPYKEYMGLAVGLKPTQHELDKNKVVSMAQGLQDGSLKYNSNKPTIISNDKYVLDGHHRWAAQLYADASKKIPIVEIGMPIRQLIALVKEFDKVSYKELHEAEIKKEKEPTNVDKVKEKQERDDEQTKRKQEDELARAREQDFLDKEKEIQKKLQDKRIEDRLKRAQEKAKSESFDAALETFLREYVEDGTPEAVAAYRAAVPGQLDEAESQKFEWFYVNDGSHSEIHKIYDILVNRMSDGATRVINGWAVTRWNDETFEVGTHGNPKATRVGAETTAEALASSTNKK